MITVTRLDPAGTAHTLRIRDHRITVDMGIADGGRDDGPDPHDLYDSALATCKALTVLWYAQRKAIPVGDIEVTVQRDNAQERKGVYVLATTLRVGGDITEAQRVELLGVAQKCPIHKLMTEVETRVTTTLVA